MDLSIIIVNYKSADKTSACIESIKDSDLSGLSFEILVVDNCSSDGGVQTIREKHNDVLIIESNRNLGMGGGNNLGIRSARGRYILVLNPDTLIRKNAIRSLCDIMEKRQNVGIAGPKLFNPDGTLQYSCLRFPKMYTPILRRTFLGIFGKRHLDSFLMKDFDHAKTSEVDWLIGSCLLIRKGLLDSLGQAFDERFFMYFEDTDLCRRAHEAGFLVIYHPEAEAIHYHSRQSAGGHWYIALFFNFLAREHIKSWFKYFFIHSKRIPRDF
jgi:hypothetical protein